MTPEEQFKNLIGHAKEYGFVFQSSEIYDGLSAVYDYGQNGVILKNRLREYWWRAMIQLNDHIVGLDSAIFMHPTVWKASGHVDAFNDPLPALKDFILPGGGPAAAACHLARTVTRRAERRVWTLTAAESAAGGTPPNPEPARYLNRLSDLLFVMARVLARHENGTEVIWRRDRGAGPG